MGAINFRTQTLQLHFKVAAIYEGSCKYYTTVCHMNTLLFTHGNTKKFPGTFTLDPKAGGSIPYNSIGCAMGKEGIKLQRRVCRLSENFLMSTKYIVSY